MAQAAPRLRVAGQAGKDAGIDEKVAADAVVGERHRLDQPQVPPRHTPLGRRRIGDDAPEAQRRPTAGVA